MDDLLWEIRASQPEDQDVSLDAVFSPGIRLHNATDEIPRSDITFHAIGNRLLPHSLLPTVSLLQFRTFRGTLAYQPCSRNIHCMDLFGVLKPIQGVQDTVFEQARTWSCFIQAIEDLPRDIRWLMATIYNFATEMLRFQNSEDYLWKMRNWLMHWYDVADELFFVYRLELSPPVIDWFSRPVPVKRLVREAGVAASEAIPSNHAHAKNEYYEQERERYRYPYVQNDVEAWIFGQRTPADDITLEYQAASQPAAQGIGLNSVGLAIAAQDNITGARTRNLNPLAARFTPRNPLQSTGRTIHGDYCSEAGESVCTSLTYGSSLASSAETIGTEITCPVRHTQSNTVYI